MSSLPHLVHIPGGTFTMGCDHAYPEERPAHSVTVDPFEMAACTVTNAQFAAFVAATGYVTTAEIPIDPADVPGMPEDYYQAGSLVFHRTDGPVDLRDPRHWWRFVKGACWHAPEGPGSDIAGREDHPVVQVSLIDAQAYVDWAGMALPTEAQWEFAARDGVVMDYPWGDTLIPEDGPRTNTWQGAFPYQNARGQEGPLSMPVTAFAPSRYGLYNMIGNVWEWTTDRFAARHDVKPCCTPPRPGEGTVHVLKGGSFLCAPSYCRRYRPSARSPQEARSATNHIGFRCVAPL